MFATGFCRLHPAADPGLSAGVFVGMEAETQRAMLDELREFHADLVTWRRQDEMERRADKDRTTVERFEQIEGNQAKILGLLHRIDEGADRDPQRRR